MINLQKKSIWMKTTEHKNEMPSALISACRKRNISFLFSFFCGGIIPLQMRKDWPLSIILSQVFITLTEFSSVLLDAVCVVSYLRSCPRKGDSVATIYWTLWAAHSVLPAWQIILNVHLQDCSLECQDYVSSRTTPVTFFQVWLPQPYNIHLSSTCMMLNSAALFFLVSYFFTYFIHRVNTWILFKK